MEKTHSQIVNEDEWEIHISQDAMGKFTLLDDIWVEPGILDDWDALHLLHYKDSGYPTGSKATRAVTSSGALVGVVLMTTCTLLLAPRHRVFPNLKPGGDTYFSNCNRARWLNKNMRRASRIVTDTLYRGGGVGYRMLNIACRMSKYRYIEILSSMSKYNSFDSRAGFIHAHLNNQRFYEEGFKFFRGIFESHPADHEAIMSEFRSFPVSVQRIVHKEMKTHYYKWSPREKTGGSLGKGESRIDKMPFPQLLRELQQLVFATPAYGVYKNPDYEIQLPERIPLRAFDWQKTNEPFNLERYFAEVNEKTA